MNFSKKIWTFFNQPAKNACKLHLKSEFIVKVDKDKIQLSDFDKNTSELSIKDLMQVSVITTDKGHRTTDIQWRLKTKARQIEDIFMNVIANSR